MVPRPLHVQHRARGSILGTGCGNRRGPTTPSLGPHQHEESGVAQQKRTLADIGVSEGDGRTLAGVTRCLLEGSGLPKFLRESSCSPRRTWRTGHRFRRSTRGSCTRVFMGRRQHCKTSGSWAPGLLYILETRGQAIAELLLKIRVLAQADVSAREETPGAPADDVGGQQSPTEDGGGVQPVAGGGSGQQGELAGEMDSN